MFLGGLMKKFVLIIFIVVFNWNLFCSQGNYENYPTIIWSEIENYAYLLMESSQLKNNSSQDVYLQEDKFEEFLQSHYNN